MNARDLMSPYVWKARDGTYQMLVRAVPKKGESGDTGTIWHATSKDGIAFAAARSNGRLRSLMPVAARTALATAGAIGGVPGSPTPDGGLVEGTM